MSLSSRIFSYDPNLTQSNFFANSFAFVSDLLPIISNSAKLDFCIAGIVERSEIEEQPIIPNFSFLFIISTRKLQIRNYPSNMWSNKIFNF